MKNITYKNIDINKKFIFKILILILYNVTLFNYI